MTYYDKVNQKRKEYRRDYGPVQLELHQAFDTLCHKIWLLEQRIEALSQRIERLPHLKAFMEPDIWKPEKLK